MIDLKAVFGDLLDTLVDEVPGFAPVIERVKRGEISEEEAARQLSILVGSNTDLMAEFERIMKKKLAPLQDETLETQQEQIDQVLPEVYKDPRVAKYIKEFEIDPKDLIFRHPTREKGLPQLHPLIQARIAERLQFDGDMPELRGGNLPQGAKPAVPVNTDVVSPIALGLMLAQGSQEVEEELLEERKRINAQYESQETSVAQILEGTANVPAVAKTGGYVPGKTPELRDIAVPSGTQLLDLSPSERQAFAWASISTTQGRVSAVRPILMHIRESLIKDGYSVSIEEGLDPETASVVEEWIYQMDHGKEEVNPNFSPINLARNALLRKLKSALGEPDDRTHCLEIVPINAVHERVVGWRAIVR